MPGNPESPNQIIIWIYETWKRLSWFVEKYFYELIANWNLHFCHLVLYWNSGLFVYSQNLKTCFATLESTEIQNCLKSRVSRARRIICRGMFHLPWFDDFESLVRFLVSIAIFLRLVFKLKNYWFFFTYLSRFSRTIVMIWNGRDKIPIMNSTTAIPNQPNWLFIHMHSASASNLLSKRNSFVFWKILPIASLVPKYYLIKSIGYVTRKWRLFGTIPNLEKPNFGSNASNRTKWLPRPK